MKKILLLLALFILIKTSHSQRVGIVTFKAQEYIYVNIDNINNAAINNYIAEITLTPNDFNLSSFPSNIENMIFYEGVSVRNHYIEYIDNTNNILKVWVKLDLLENTIHSLKMLIRSVNSSVDWDSFFKRKSMITNTEYLYNFKGLYDSTGTGSNAVLTGATIMDSKYDSILTCDGVNDFATVDIAMNDYGWISFNWVLPNGHSNGDGVRTIFHKYFDATNEIYFQLQNDGRIRFVYRRTDNIYGYYTTKNYWSAGESNHFSMRWVKTAANGWGLYRIELDEAGNNPHDFKAIQLTGGEPFTFGCYNNGSQSEFSEVYIYDFEMGDGYQSLPSELSRNKGIEIFEDSEVNKWEFVTELPNTSPDIYLRQEPNLLTYNDTIWLYVTDESVGGTEISRSYSVDTALTWSTPQAITGVGAISARPFVYYEADTTWMCKSYGDICYSINGVDFTGCTEYLPDSLGQVQNVSFIKDGDTYKGMAETFGVAGWDLYSTVGTHPTAMEFTTNVMQTSVNLGVHRVLTSGPHLIKIGDAFYLWSHGPIPSTIWAFSSDNYDNDSWVVRYDHEIFTMDSEWCIDQKADVSIVEYNGYCIAAVNNSDNTPAVIGNTSIYRYNGTLENLVKDTDITTIYK